MEIGTTDHIDGNLQKNRPNSAQMLKIGTFNWFQPHPDLARSWPVWGIIGNENKRIRQGAFSLSEKKNSWVDFFFTKESIEYPCLMHEDQIIPCITVFLFFFSSLNEVYIKARLTVKELKAESSIKRICFPAL